MNIKSRKSGTQNQNMSTIFEMPGHLIRRLHQISISVFADRMKALGHDVTPLQFAAMSVLSKHPDIDQATLSGLIANDRPTTGGVIERLEKKNLLKRSRSAEDRRAKVVSLTPEGQKLLEELLPEVQRFQSKILPGLTDEEREQFIRLASKVAEAGNDLSRAPFIPFKG